mmetsp:Transcript_43569/g.102393  ORF Transcript_43569/g.102393 Transcript_43569/m.102393 type:complete len:315 (-) Transcript_43569:31-975(-)|eukprot:CAMPEP_0177708020 /NCGR_PEP_ID=MMETSP0484_2-20121128/10057_1 /TAXON_ID=354590 /ORGANISM="Rhodomonas lens, Strain RHODO" /LENGTH=314 /DNA_ID=CAMNT_0019219563 /DNA_START=26 /DNA_END=970 /DNA_ORIENTATION=-
MNVGTFSSTPSVIVQAISPFFQVPLEWLNSLGGPPAKIDLPWPLLALTCQEAGPDGKSVYNIDLVFLSIFGRALAGSYAVRKAKPNISLFHSYVLSVLTAFGGGVLGGMLCGDPPIPCANDMPIFASLVAWWAINFFPADLFCAFYASTLGQMFGKTIDGMARYRQIFNQLHKAASKFKRTPYYPNPVAGPLIIGTISACGGAFMPFDKGINALENGPFFPWRSAFLAALTFYFTTVDTYVSPVVLHYVDVDTIRAGVTGGLILVDIVILFFPKLDPFPVWEAAVRLFISGGEEKTLPMGGATPPKVDPSKKKQ